MREDALTALTEALRTSTVFEYSEDLDSVEIRCTMKIRFIVYLVFIAMALVMLTVGLVAMLVQAFRDPSSRTLFLTTAVLLLFPDLLLLSLLLRIIQGFRSVVQLTATALTLPIGTFPQPVLIPLEEIVSIQGIESRIWVETRTRMVKAFYPFIPNPDMETLTRYLSAQVGRRRRQLSEAGHDLTEPATIPGMLSQIRDAGGKE